MTQQTIDNQGGGEAIIGEAATPKRKFSLDSGFKRNLTIIGGAILLALAAMVVLVFGAKGVANANADKVPPSSIPNTQVGKTEATPSQAELERLGRVQKSQSEEALKARETYIPKDNPFGSSKVEAPPTKETGAGPGYNYTLNNSAPAYDSQRDANIRNGIAQQLKAIADRATPPPVQVAASYAKPEKAEATNTAQVAAEQKPAAPTQAEPLISALSIVGARMVSHYDSDKSAYVSAVINSGPLTGALVIGQGVLNPNEGVQLKFTRMRHDGKDYQIDVTALDTQTSSDAINADIDRKLLSRYVIPIAFVAAQAYMGAISKPAQSIVSLANIGGGSSTAVVTPAATTLQATAAAAQAGLGQAVGKLGAQVPSAQIPVDTSIGLLFNSAVYKK